MNRRQIGLAIANASRVAEPSALTPGLTDGEVRVAALLKERLLEPGPRGINSPRATPRDAAIVVLAFGGRQAPTEAPDGVRAFAPLIPLGGGDDLVTALAEILSSVERANEVAELRLNMSSSSARIDFKDGGRRLYFRPGVDPGDTPQMYGRSWLYRESVIGPALLKQVAAALVDGDEAGDPVEWSA